MKEKLLTALVLLTILVSGLYFGLPRLKTFTGTDETLWSYDRIPTFWNNIGRQRWKGTKINDKPGITLAILSGVSLPFIPNPKESRDLAYQAKTPEQLHTINNLYFYLRLPVFLFFLAVLPLFYWLIRKLLGENVARFSAIFIGLSPIILGISLVLNPDSLLWAFLPLSILSYLIFQQDKNKKYLYLSGLFLGLALLTKYVANILYVYFLLLLFFDYIFNQKNQTTPLFRYLKEALFNYGILVAISMAVFFLLFPATWVRPSLLLEGTLLSQAFRSTWPLFAASLGLILLDTVLLKNKALEKIVHLFIQYKLHLLRFILSLFLFAVAVVFLNTHLSMPLYNFENILAWPKGGDNPVFELSIFISRLLAGLYGLIFGLTPFVFISFLSALVYSVKEKVFSQKNLVTFYFIFFILFYYIASSFNFIAATVRYQIVLYPLASIIAAIGLTQLLESEKIQKHATKINLNLIIILSILFVSFFSLVTIRPFYFSYASSLLPSRYLINPLDLGGGSYEVSTYLNKLPDAKNLSIWTDKKQVCEKFIGRCTSNLKPHEISNITFDYFIASRGGASKTIGFSRSTTPPFKIGTTPIDVEKLYAPDQYYDFKITIGGRPQNFIKVSEAKDVSN